MDKIEFIYEKPINVYYEITIACDLKCKHCRAEAIPERNPEELNINEIKKFFDDIKNLGSNLIISGGDPLKREDIFEALEYARKINLPFGIAPTTSPLLNFEKIKKIKDLGAYAMSISLDGSNKEAQDSFRGVEGTFEISLNALKFAKELNIPIQVNTTFTKENFNEIEKIYYFLKENFSEIVKRWSIFFIVPVGRGKELKLPSKDEIKEIIEFLYEKSKEAPFQIATTEAPFYRVFYVLKEIKKGKNIDEVIRENKKLGFGVRDGNGVVFVSHKGDIYPSGFLNLKVSNIKNEKLSFVYKNNKIFKELRDTDLLKGKCGKCKYKKICGGSRARAYAIYEDYLEEDPFCVIF